MLKNVLLAAALSVVAASAIADNEARAQAEQTIAMKDGSTLYIFKDGKMAMADKYGRATRMEKGVVMETKNGDKLIMIGDEVGRLAPLLKQDHRGS